MYAALFKLWLTMRNFFSRTIFRNDSCARNQQEMVSEVRGVSVVTGTR